MNVLSENRNPKNDIAIEYMAPKVVNAEVEIEIDDEDITSEVRFWETALIMYVLRYALSMKTVKNHMMKT